MTSPIDTPDSHLNLPPNDSSDASAPLRARIAELEQQLVQVQQDHTAERKHAQDTAQVYEETVTNLLTGMLIMELETPHDPTSFRLLAANPAASRFTNTDLQPFVGRYLLEAFPNAMDSGIAPIYEEIARNGGVRDLGEIAYSDARVAKGFFSIRAFGLPNQRVCVAFENITERKHAEEVLRQSMLQEEIIQVQAAALAELSTPLIPLNDEVVVMPIIGTVDSRRAQQVLETLLTGIGTTGAQVAILDITGVSVVDTQVANVFISAAQAVKLLGAQVVLTGIRPEVAQTLVGLGVDLGDIITHSSLQRGIAYAFNRRKGRVSVN